MSFEYNKYTDPKIFIFESLESLTSTNDISDIIYRDDFPGFKEDYTTIHCLLKKYSPLNLLEIGTNTGTGTYIICNALKGKNVYSMDLPPEITNEQMYPNKEDGKPPISEVGINCKLPYTQLWGDSTQFNYKDLPYIDAWFIDGKHNFEYVNKDTTIALGYKPLLLIWHDCQIEEVTLGALEAMKNQPYTLYHVDNTRIIYAVRN